MSILETNPFSRLRPNYPNSVFVEGDTPTLKSYEIERLLNKRIFPKGRSIATEYLVKWKGYGPIYNKWYNVKKLGNASEGRPDRHL